MARLTHLRVHDIWLLLPQRVALHEPTGTAVIADVHLGYSERRRRLGDAVPLPAVGDQLAPLRAVVAAWDLRGLVVAGDLFERGFEPNLFAGFLEALRELGLPLLGLTPGNHDRVVPTDAVTLYRDGYPLG